MELPKGVSMSVPDLSQFGKKPKDPIAIKVNPGDRIMVLLPIQATQQDVGQLSSYLKQWAPHAEFIVLAGPEAIVTIPAIEEPDDPKDHTLGLRHDPHPVPMKDKEPQGLVTALGPDATCYCEGADNLHRKGTGELCKDESRIPGTALD